MSILGLIFLISIMFTGCCIKHEYGDPVVHAPTCTQRGYTLFACSKCGDSYQDDFVSALGHSTYVSKEGTEPTCVSNGYCDELTCRVCGEVVQEKEIISATGHSIIITKEEIPATCIAQGLTAEHHCSVCNALLQAQVTIEPYNHADSDGNSLCDRCGIPHGNNIIYIDTVEELKAINNNLSGVYQLSANIDLTGQSWIALGSDTSPFSGYLYGNGFTIKGLSFSNSSNALFSYVSGVIDGVVIENVSFSSTDYSANMGGFAIYNKGTIKNCYLKGTNTISQSISRTQTASWPSYDGSKVTYKNVFGGLCAINEGKISNCTIDSSFSSTFSNKNYFQINLGLGSLFPPIDGQMYESICESTIYFGGVCGENKGTITNCIVTNADASKISVVADFDKYGSSYAITNAYIGSIVGVNSKNVSNCSAKSSTVVENVGSTSTNGNSGGQHPKLNLYMDNTYRGIVGKNNGTVDNTLYN